MYFSGKTYTHSVSITQIVADKAKSLSVNLYHVYLVATHDSEKVILSICGGRCFAYPSMMFKVIALSTADKAC